MGFTRVVFVLDPEQNPKSCSKNSTKNPCQKKDLVGFGIFNERFEHAEKISVLLEKGHDSHHKKSGFFRLGRIFYLMLGIRDGFPEYQPG